MFGWIVTGDTLSQLLHRCRMGRIIQEYAGDRQPDLPEEDFGGVNNEEAEQQELNVSQPKCSKIYYNTCAEIDQHNLHR